MVSVVRNGDDSTSTLGDRYSDARKSFEAARTIWERELGPESRSLADALTGIGISHLAEGNPTSALAPLERALTIRQTAEPDPTKRADTEFNLARALWASHRDRPRARVLAERAKDGYARATARPKLIEVDQWLRERDAS